MFDLTIFPLSLNAGREQFELPGLLAQAATRKAARMRAQDMLVLYCSLESRQANGNHGPALTPAQQHEILQKLAETYFSFPGSVTAGLRAVANRLNDFLLNRNLKQAHEGQMVGLLNMAAIHGDSLIVAHAGPTHSFMLKRSQVQHFDDTLQGPGGLRGLGLSRQAVPRFYQVTLEAGDLLLFSPEPPTTWTARALANSPQLSLEYLRRRLLSDAGVDLEAAVVRFQPGKGQVNFWKPGEPGAAAPGKSAAAGAASSAAAGRTPAGRAVPSTPRVGGRPTTAPASPSAAEPTGSVPPVRSTAADVPAAAEPPVFEPPTLAEPTPVVEETPALDTSPAAEQPAIEEPTLTTEPPADSPAATEARVDYAVPDLSTLDYEPLPPLEETSPDSAFNGDAGIAASREEKAAEPGDLEPPSPDPAAPKVEPPVSAVPPDITASRRALLRSQVDSSGAGTLPTAPKQGPSSISGLPPMRRMPSTMASQPAAQPAVPAPRTNGGSDSTLPAAPARERLRKPQRAKQAARAEQGPGSLRLGLASIWQRGRRARAKADGAMARAASALPKRRDARGQEQPFFNFSPGVMLAIALIIPAIVVAVATTVYFRAGRTEQFQLLFLQAQQYAQQASQQQDPALQRKSLEQACGLVHKAELYDRSNESTAFREQVCSALDGLNGYVRLNYQPAVTQGFPTSVNITRIVTTLNDVYLLDSSRGIILRMYRTSGGYEVDPTFTCGGAGQAGTVIVDPLIDMAALPPSNSMNATVMGVDGRGNLIYCSPSLSGFEAHPLAAPDNGWKKIRAMVLFNEALFVLDPEGNGVYRFDGIGSAFNNAPHLYFETTIPQLDDVIDLAVDEEFLYLLHSSGRMTVCESGGFAYSGSKCTDPAPYGDARPGFEPSPLEFSGSRFIQIRSTQPPDPSLFALDAANQSIYHLSLRRLNLQREYRPVVDTDFPLPNGAPTAFAIAPNRRALLAFGNRVFFSPLP